MLMEYKDEEKKPTTFNSSSQHRLQPYYFKAIFKHSPFSIYTLSQTSNQQGTDLRVLPNCDIILMPPVPACQALSLDKGECSIPHRIKFKKPGGKQQCREGALNLAVACTSQHPLPFHTQIHVVSTWQNYIYNAQCLKIKLFLISAMCLYLGFSTRPGVSFKQWCLRAVVTEM